MKPVAYEAGPPAVVNGLITADLTKPVEDRYNVLIKFCGKGWAIYDGSLSLSKGLERFDYDSMPSSRDEAFFEDRRWPTAEEANEYYKEWYVKKTEEARENEALVKITQERNER